MKSSKMVGKEFACLYNEYLITRNVCWGENRDCFNHYKDLCKCKYVNVVNSLAKTIRLFQLK